jgi:hypothetical protein
VSQYTERPAAAYCLASGTALAGASTQAVIDVGLSWLKDT